MWPPSEHPSPTTKIGSKLGGEFAYQPKWDPRTVLSHCHVAKPPEARTPDTDLHGPCSVLRLRALQRLKGRHWGRRLGEGIKMCAMVETPFDWPTYSCPKDPEIKRSSFWHFHYNPTDQKGRLWASEPMVIVSLASC